MNKNYIKSDNINVFPCGNRANYPHNRWLTEYNLVSIVNRLVDADTFVVTHNLEVVGVEGKPNLNQEFTFNISGYIAISFSRQHDVGTAACRNFKTASGTE